MMSDGETALAEPLMRTEHDLELLSLSPLVERAHWTGGISQVGSAPIPIPHNPSVRLTRCGALWSDERPCDPRASRRPLHLAWCAHPWWSIPLLKGLTKSKSGGDWLEAPSVALPITIGPWGSFLISRRLWRLNV